MKKLFLVSVIFIGLFASCNQIDTLSINEENFIPNDQVNTDVASFEGDVILN